MVKRRLDVLLVELNLCASRSLAQRLIQAGEVTVNQQMVVMVGTEVDSTAEIKIKERSRFVSRGGDKLAKALELFTIPVQARVCLDGGISTGGFTDCLLKYGAKKVYGIDVGYGQVDWGLRNDSRLILRERTNLRHLTPDDLYAPKDEVPDLAVVDVSFISLNKILPALWQLTQAPRDAVLLVKPQFEVGKSRVGKKGVVRNPEDQADAIFQVLQASKALGWEYKNLTWSPITGPAGNVEYLLWLSMNSEKPPLNLAAVREITQSALADLRV